MNRLLSCLWVLLACSPLLAAPDIPDVFTQEVARFARLCASDLPELRVEGAQGFGYLKHQSGEAPLLPLLSDADLDVRIEAIRAAGHCGGRRTAPLLIDCLDDGSWHERKLAHAGLQRMTGQQIPDDDPPAWRRWLEQDDWKAKQARLLADLNSENAEGRKRALTALRYLGDHAAEEPLLAWAAPKNRRHWTELRLVILALERIGTAKSLPLLTSAAPHFREAAWALAEIAGPQAEDALLHAAQRFRTRDMSILTNLDRIHTTRCERFLPELLRGFGLAISRSMTDELFKPPTARQRMAGNIILRTGKADQLVDLILAECEGKRQDAATPPALRKVLAGMRPELGKGFARQDSGNVAWPLAALPHITTDPKFVPRLIALLRHRAYVVRIYAATTLGALHAEEAVQPILDVIREPYPFADATAQASGKHFGHSQTVRWRGFLCMALGKLGNEPARLALEELAANADNYRDVRYGAVVGLRFIASPKSIPTLQRVTQGDIIWMIRDTASRTLEEIELRRAAGEALP